ncbi:tumor necrosis factor receptor superfamily member 5-like [Notolabrus celidotus]|uniref:tumor necrosis factor receptor superfamily member 5-like n=1 Tax=Notolabrus celidotus TaxID=1203425 RepID=UPI001490394C|nr:tumor necrosis factor receptor superfamily member 5-like [Notolabrus celidotus]
MMFRKKFCSTVLLLILMKNVLRGQAIRCHASEYAVGYLCCTKCPEGFQVLRHCTESEITHCGCPEGTFMDHTRCSPCTKCDAGSGLRMKTSCMIRSDSVCEPQEGFFCTQPAEHSCLNAQRHRSCTPGQYISQRGTSLTDAVCSPCSAGSFSDGTFPSCQEHTQCESLNLQLLRPGTESDDAECGEKDSD